jgi:hypothetical protein
MIISRFLVEAMNLFSSRFLREAIGEGLGEGNIPAFDEDKGLEVFNRLTPIDS